jgi:hypothetical protein
MVKYNHGHVYGISWFSRDDYDFNGIDFEVTNRELLSNKEMLEAKIKYKTIPKDDKSGYRFFIYRLCSSMFWPTKFYGWVECESKYLDKLFVD